MARRRRAHWHLGLTALLLAGAALSGLVVHWYDEEPAADAIFSSLPPATTTDAHAFADSLHAQVDSALAELGIWPELIHKQRAASDSLTVVDHISVRVPADLPLTAVNLSLSRFVRWHGGRVFEGIQRNARRVDVRCGLDSVETTLFSLRHDRRLKRRTGRIAIVLDDFGYTSGDDLLHRFCSLPQSLTMAVLPNEGQASTIVDLAHRHGHEVLLHLPMEPRDYPEQDPGAGAIFTNQDGDTIRRLVRQALARVRGAVGVNNHMGSRATADSRVMEQVLTEVKHHNLFFLDSRTTAESLCLAVASALELPAAQRDLFIDPVDEDGRVQSETVEGQLWRLAAIAVADGQAIGIGHDREQTLLALEAVLPRLESRGHRFVPVSELVQ